jgi:hypothetical protein
MLKNTALYSRKKNYGHMRVGSSPYSPVNNGTRLNKEKHIFSVVKLGSNRTLHVG